MTITFGILIYSTCSLLTLILAIVIDYYDYYVDVDIGDYIMLSVLLWPMFIIPYTILAIRIISIVIKENAPFRKNWFINIWSKALKRREKKTWE